MKRFLMSVALTATLLVPLTADQAAAANGNARGEHRGWRSTYHLRHGTKFRHGYYYRGRNHHHWTYRYHWARYRCNCYWCPGTFCWYYFCQPRDCYLPVICIDEAPPARVNTAAASSWSSNVVAPTVVTNVIGMPPQPGPVAIPSDLTPPLPPSAPNKVTNTAIGSIGAVQPFTPFVPMPHAR